MTQQSGENDTWDGDSRSQCASPGRARSQSVRLAVATTTARQWIERFVRWLLTDMQTADHIQNWPRRDWTFPLGQGLGYVRMSVMNERGRDRCPGGDVCCIRLHASFSRTQLGDVCDRRLHSAVCSVEMECVASWLGRLSVCPSVTSTRTVLRSQHNNRVDWARHGSCHCRVLHVCPAVYRRPTLGCATPIYRRCTQALLSVRMQHEGRSRII